MLLDLFVRVQNAIAGRKAEMDERGATAVEYALMVSLIAVAVIAAVRTLGTNSSDKFTSAGTAIH